MMGRCIGSLKMQGALWMLSMKMHESYATHVGHRPIALVAFLSS